MHHIGVDRGIVGVEIDLAVAQVGEEDRARAGLAHAGRVLDRGAAVGEAGGVPGGGVPGTVGGEADGAAVGATGGGAVDRRGQQEAAAVVGVDQAALGVALAGGGAEGREQGVVERLGSREVVAADHDVAEHRGSLLVARGHCRDSRTNAGRA